MNEQSDNRPSPERHEAAERIFPRIIMEANLTERVHCDPIRVLEAMERVGIPADKTHDLALVFVDANHYATSPDSEVNGAFLIGTEVSFGDGSEEGTFNHIIGILLRDKDRNSRSAEDIDRTIIHELTHMRQYLENNDFREKGAMYARPKVQKRVRTAGKLALGLPIAAGGATAYEAGRAFMDFYEAHSDLATAYETLPKHGLPAIALGVVAVGLGYGRDAVKNKVYRWMHKLDPYEKEARANEVLSKDFPMVTLA